MFSACTIDIKMSNVPDQPKFRLGRFSKWWNFGNDGFRIIYRTQHEWKTSFFTGIGYRTSLTGLFQLVLFWISQESEWKIMTWHISPKLGPLVFSVLTPRNTPRKDKGWYLKDHEGTDATDWTLIIIHFICKTDTRRSFEKENQSRRCVNQHHKRDRLQVISWTFHELISISST